MPERKSRKASISRKRKKQTDVATHAEILPVKDLWEHTFDSMPDLIAILDNRHRIVRANKAMAQRLSVTPDECIGLNCFKCVHKLNAPPSFCPHSLTMADGKEHIVEIHEDNLGGDFLVSITPLFDNQGKIIGSVHVARDITERKKAEEEIKSLSRFPSENPNVVMRISKDGNVLYSNNAGLQILNEWKCQVGQPVPSKWLQLVTDVFTSGIKKDFEEEYANRTFLITLAPVLDTGYANVYGRDITERKQAEQALQQSEEKYRSIVETAQEGIMVANPEGKIVLANERIAQVLGYTVEELMVKSGLELVSEREVVRAQERLKNRKQGVKEQYEVWMRRKDGSEVCLLASEAPMFDIEGRHIGNLGMYTDITERKRAEEALRKAHEELEMRIEERTKELRDASVAVQAERKRFFDVLEKLPAYMVLLTPDYHVSYANRFFRERFGEDKGRRCFEYLFNRSEPCEPCETYKTLKKMAPLEWEWAGPDGHNYYIFDSPFTDVDGSTLIMEVGIDITERKKAEEKLSAASLYSRSLIEASLDPLVTINAEGKITDVNEATEAVTGFSRNQLIGSDFSNYFTEPEKARVGYKQVFTEGFVRDYPLAIRNKNGKITDVLYNATVYKNELGEVQGVFAAARDITERKRAQEALREAHDELEMRVDQRTKELREAAWKLQAEITERKKTEQALRESQLDLNRAQTVAKTGSWRLDVRNNALLWSDETYRMFGIPKGTSLTYETFLNAIHPEDRAYVDKEWQAAMRGEPYDVEHRIIVDGKVKWVREKSELEFDKDGQFLGGFGTVQEITEIKEMQAKLEQYSLHLEQLVEEKTQKLKEAERLVTIGETAGMVGHDIRNPLQSIEGSVYLAKEELESLPDTIEKRELKQILEVIRHQTNYIDNIVADLQDFSRTPYPQLKEANIHELIREAASTTEIPANIQIQRQIEDDIQTITVDPVFIKRILTNLVENAVHAMPKGGQLIIKVFKQDECIGIHVEDTGVGISEEDKPKIFTPLFTTKAKGQGFGLAVCKKLVEAHRGEMTFESEAGKGTVFKIKLSQRKETA